VRTMSARSNRLGLTRLPGKRPAVNFLGRRRRQPQGPNLLRCHGKPRHGDVAAKAAPGRKKQIFGAAQQVPERVSND
jgi:hypothetical protein